MENSFDSFVLFAEMRTGSNFLESNLNAMTGVTCHGEVFNPYFIGRRDQSEFLGFSLVEREANPLLLLRVMRDSTEGLAGFRYFHDHDARVFAPVMADRRCAKIVLTRNPVESYISWKIAQQTNQWKLTNVKNLKTAQVEFDASEFEMHLEKLQNFQIQIMHALQCSGQTAFYIDYEDINDLDVLNGLAQFLGADAITALDGSLKKQNPEEIGQKVSNLDEMEQALARLDRFNLSRTPNFEPRRPAMVPHMVAAREAGLLYMPMKSGPVEQVTGWLAQFGGLEGDFNQKSLRQWKRARPGHRSFTVLRHPVARAHDAFCLQILSGALSDIRKQLERVHKLSLPKAGQDYPDAASHAAGFLAFLKWLKLNLSGQTGTKIDLHWASQSTLLQGFSGFQAPDYVLREETLTEGLGFLAQELGLESPALPIGVPHGFTPLSQVYSAEIEQAARDAYTRDYMSFGFGNYLP